MSAWGYHDGQRATERGTLADTSATTILDASTQAYDVVSIILVNHSTGALTPVVDVYDGTTAYPLRDDASLADQAREVVDIGDFIKLQRGDVLRITANANLTWFVSYVIPYKPTGTHA